MSWGQTIPIHGLESGGLKTQGTLPWVEQEATEERLLSCLHLLTSLSLNHCHRTQTQQSKSKTRLCILPAAEEASGCQGLTLEPSTLLELRGSSFQSFMGTRPNNQDFEPSAPFMISEKKGKILEFGSCWSRASGLCSCLRSSDFLLCSSPAWVSLPTTARTSTCTHSSTYTYSVFSKKTCWLVDRVRRLICRLLHCSTHWTHYNTCLIIICLLYYFVFTVSQYRVKATEDKYSACRGMHASTPDLDTLKGPGRG